MTLSRWLRDYLYIPLGGSRQGELRTAVNIMITMLLGGLWHGAGWTFVAWGGLHGVGPGGRPRRRRARGARAGAADRSPRADRTGPGWRRVATFHLVCLGWVFFRAESIGSAFVRPRAAAVAGGAARRSSRRSSSARSSGCSLSRTCRRRRSTRRGAPAFSRLGPVAARARRSPLVLFATTSLGPEGVAPFIYFRF